MNGKVLERYAELMIDKIRQMSAGEWQKPWFTPPCRPATEHIRASVQQHEPSYALHGDGQDGIHPPGIHDLPSAEG
ncbi:ArdC family protein [Phocaeicola vulgatus]|uniref:ArdC family protein n=1 Tax=Phocaeicola vulgatus TaxID=821 RepID=UPI001F2D0031|nr:ArdC family protein [Phocaeicola vulgatus]MCG0353499.1 ArdC family protein [Phocaeicola vulgatus]